MNRRDFLKMLGGGLVALGVSKLPIQKEEPKPSLNLDEVAAKNYNTGGVTANYGYWYGTPFPMTATSYSKHNTSRQIDLLSDEDLT